MFLLTEGTLFFLDLALEARACDEKPSLSSVVQKWVDEVAAATTSDDSAGGAHTTTGASSSLFVSCPVYPSTAVGQISASSDTCGVASGSTHQSALMFSKNFFLADDEDPRETVTNDYSEASESMGTSSVIASSISDSDSDYCRSDLDTPLSQQQQDALRGVKRKIDDTDFVSDAKMKKGRYEVPSVPSLSALPKPALGCAAFIAQLQALRVPQVDNEGYIIEVIKRHSEYTTKDLPVPYDKRWFQFFISTAILWYSVQENIWNVPNEELSSALQRIFNVIYPDIKYRVTPGGSVFVLTLQRINEWRSSFGSSALAMLLHFFSSFDDDDDDDVYAAAEFLATDSRFLWADPDSSEPTEPFRSPFLLILLAITHLGDIAAFVDVPGWDTQAMAAGNGGEGVIAIASAALERALTFFRDGTLDTNHVLAATACCSGALSPRTMLDTLALPALQFSSANWNSRTATYREALWKCGTTFVRGTFAAAQAKRLKIAGDKDGESEVVVDVSVSEVPDPRVPLCVGVGV